MRSPTRRGDQRDGHRRARRRAAELIVGDDARRASTRRAIDKVFDRFYTGDTRERLRAGAGDRRRARRCGWTASWWLVSRRGHTAFTLQPARSPSAADAARARRGRRVSHDRLRRLRSGRRWRLALIAAGCGGGGDTTTEPAAALADEHPAGGRPGERRRLQPGRDLSRTSRPGWSRSSRSSIGRRTRCSGGGGSAGQGSGFVVSKRRRDRHQRPRGHRAAGS